MRERKVAFFQWKICCTTTIMHSMLKSIPYIADFEEINSILSTSSRFSLDMLKRKAREKRKSG